MLVSLDDSSMISLQYSQSTESTMSASASEKN